MIGNGNSSLSRKLDTLRKREAALKAAIVVEQVRRQKTKEKLAAKEHAVVGEALCRYAEQTPDFHLMLRQVLKTSVTDIPARRFLEQRGWM